MAKLELSSKRVQLDKANALVVIVVAVACFVTIFSLTASKALLSQRNYQAKVIGQKQTAKKSLKDSVVARDKLVSQYKQFTSSSSNLIGGSSSGTGDRDGDNAKIILDALPSKYDYPALATSLEKLMLNSGLTIQSIAGTDDELNQANSAASSSPTVTEMPFTLSFSGDAQATNNFLDTLQRSIRPIQVSQVTISGSNTKLTTNIVAKTYYQPEKTFTVKTEIVK